MNSLYATGRYLMFIDTNPTGLQTSFYGSVSLRPSQKFESSYKLKQVQSPFSKKIYANSRTQPEDNGLCYILTFETPCSLMMWLTDPSRFTKSPSINHSCGTVLVLQEHRRMAGFPDDGKGTGNPQREQYGKNMKSIKCEHISREWQVFAFGRNKECVKGNSGK